ncbi:MAG TPA: hypothetical protein VEM96_07615 [Pyrinomonadaceae bacterium]|nr:hypothetical protein [Pyrinomonadaceae bacterium]
MLKAETPVVSVFGKSWRLHVTDALRVGCEENLEIIADTISYLSARVSFVIYDAEHFFDGYRNDPLYALETLRAALSGGPRRIVFCDTNGGKSKTFALRSYAPTRSYRTLWAANEGPPDDRAIVELYRAITHESRLSVSCSLQIRHYIFSRSTQTLRGDEIK